MNCRNTDDSTSSSDGAEARNSNSNLIATIAATEAAIQIASDIIDSTLAHADDHSENRIDRRHSLSMGKCVGFIDSFHMGRVRSNHISI